MIVFVKSDYTPNTSTAHLVNTALYNYYGKRFELEYDANGAPRLKDSDLFISISHSYDAFVFGISNHPLGLDIEYIKLRAFERIENKVGLPHSTSELEFYQNWTAYESRYKLGDISCDYRHYDVLSGYAFAIASVDKIITFLPLEV